jgi:hypothetical protein
VIDSLGGIPHFSALYGFDPPVLQDADGPI